MNFSTLRYDRHGRVGIATFSRPEALNAIDEARLDDLEALLDAAEADEELGALIITATGRAFCVGLDLGLLEKAFDDVAYFEATVRRLNGIITRIEALPMPVIAAINGFTRAGGFEMALGCDFIIMADEAKIGDVHTDAGVVPACVTTRLKRKIGDQRAKELLWTARWLTGSEAVEYGLALRSVPLDRLVEEALAFAATLVDKPRPAIAMLKDSLRTGADMNAEDAAEQELQLFARYMREQPYGREGYYAFREKRQPSWKVPA
jgi:enoyl-CoA hydratase/carnithine racemase